MSFIQDTSTSSFDRQGRFALWWRLWATTRPYRREVRWLCLFAFLTAALDVSFPLVTKEVVDGVDAQLSGGPEFDLTPWIALYLTLTVAFCICIVAFIRLAGTIRTHVAHDLRRDGFSKLQDLSFAYFDRRPVGWLMARMTSDIERLSNILAWGVLDLVWGLTMMGGIAGILLWMNAKLALATLLVVPLLLWTSARFKTRILESSRRVRKTNSRLTAAYNESLQGVRTAKAFAREEADLDEFRGLAGTMHAASMRNSLQSALFVPVVLTLGSLATGVALAWGGYEVAFAGLSVGTLVAFLTYVRHFFDPVNDLAHWYAELQMARVSAERILGLIDEEPRVKDTPLLRYVVGRNRRRARREGLPTGSTPGHAPGHADGVAEDGLADRVGAIEFRGVGFAYDEGGDVLHDIDLTVQPGETIALVGATGGGKSTLVNLLCRFYEPTRGEILIDGIEYRRRGLGWLQSKLGIVLQAPHLFGGTIAENIRYGNLEASDAEVEQAARLAGCHDFVGALPDGYATQVGEGGVRLSTGEKQLVSLARAILAGPEILILDEATSSVDTESERRIQAALDHVLTGRTSFVIAHRLSTIRTADRILVIDGGRIVEQGTHGELLALRGRYYDLTTQQRLRESGRRAWTDGAQPSSAPLPA